jgi:hypothetical protein
MFFSWSLGADAAPLQVHETNPRYFTDGSGNVVYLAGNHRSNHVTSPTGGIMVDFNGQHQQNYIRLWVWETEKLPWGSAAPGPFARPGPGTATDGGPRFDLEQWNPEFFENLRNVVTQARDRGIYVSVMLFQGFSIVQKGAFGNHWFWHPFSRRNNINDIEGDLNGDDEGEETHTLADPQIVQIQQAYVRKVVDTLNDLDNVLYEISNEDPQSPENTAWQYAMTRYIQDYEAGRIDGIVRNRHPVGITGGGPTDEELYASPADWISPTSKLYFDTPESGLNQGKMPASTGQKVILLDTDHIFGNGGSRDWVWKAFMRGLNPVQLLDNDPPDLHPFERELAPALGHTVTYARRMNLAAMAPRGDLSTTTFCLADPGSEYLVYQAKSGAFTLNLERGTYRYEWFDVDLGVVVQTGSFSIGTQSLRIHPPVSGNVVLYLKSTPR